MYMTFLVEKMSAKWCREKTRTISGNILDTNLPRDVREVSSFETKKRNCGLLVEQYMGYKTNLRLFVLRVKLF